MFYGLTRGTMANGEWREYRLGIQLLPIMLISAVLFTDVGFTRDWTSPELGRNGVREGCMERVLCLCLGSNLQQRDCFET